MKKVLLVIFVFLFSISLVYASGNQDVINLKDGSILRGEIIETNSDFIIIKTSLGEIKVKKEDIKNTPVTVYLKDDNIIKGNLIKRNETAITIKTSLGTFEVQLEKITKIIKENNVKIENNKQNTVNNTESTDNKIETLSNVLLYQQKQKKVSTALGFQTLGAGLLYTENYSIGTIMLFAENGLLISSAFVDNPEIVPYLWMSGLVLKGVNTFLTIKSVNDYNDDLASRMGLIDSNSNEIKINSGQDYLFIAPNLGIGFGDNGSLAFGGTLGWGNYNFGRIGINYTGVLENYTSNITLQYEYPIIMNNKLRLTPKFGFGYVSGHKYNESEDEWFAVSGIGLVAGLSGEYNISKHFILKLGYDQFLGLSEGDASNGEVLMTFGLRL